MSNFSSFGALTLSFSLVCPGQPIMIEIWSAYDSYAGASHISVGHGDFANNTVVSRY